MRQRVISGSLLGVGIATALLVDGWLSSVPSPRWPLAGTNLGTWLCHGAILTLVVLVLSALTSREMIGFVRVMGFRPNRAVVQLFAAGLVIGPYISFNLKQEADWYDESYYAGAPQWNPLGPEKARAARSVRGGSFSSPLLPTGDSTTHNRSKNVPNLPIDRLGCRCAWSANER